jgi:hypothetical protein
MDSQAGRIPPAPVVLGIVLGKLIEYNFRRGVIMRGYSVFFTDTLAFVVLSLATLSLSALRSLRNQRFCIPLSSCNPSKIKSYFQRLFPTLTFRRNKRI